VQIPRRFAPRDDTLGATLRIHVIGPAKRLDVCRGFRFVDEAPPNDHFFHDRPALDDHFVIPL
jgi:hypothetical protein